MLEARARRMERDLEDLQDDPRALFRLLIRLCGTCGDELGESPCVRHMGHSGPHASEWKGRLGLWLRRNLWGTFRNSSGEQVTFVPSMKAFRLSSSGIQTANFGNWKAFHPIVPPPGVAWGGEGEDTLLDEENTWI